VDERELRLASAAVARNAELLDVRLARIVAQLNPDRRTAATPPFAIDISIAQNVSALPAPGDRPATITYEHDYVLNVNAGGELAATLECSMLATFAYSKLEELTTEEIDAYGATTVAYALYPYLRELVHDITGRFGLPVLMPVFRVSPQTSSASVDEGAPSEDRRPSAQRRRANRKTAAPR
jgi:hypothetical protein